ncbi:MAG: T9SS type A sorting domain-containing protein [Chitinophagales bacterium]|nr:T9SS type A sorting domain-containing protein [Chitinophagales bacterium]
MITKAIIPGTFMIYMCWPSYSQSITNTYLKGGDNDGYAMSSVIFLPPPPVNITDVMTGQESLFPNPVSGSLHLNLAESRDYTSIEIYNVLGSIIFSVPFNEREKTYTLDVSKIPAGAYYCKMGYEHHNYSTIYFVKE